MLDFYKDLSKDCVLLYDTLNRKPLAWWTSHMQAVQRIRLKAKEPPCLNSHTTSLQNSGNKCFRHKIQCYSETENKNQLVRFTSEAWNPAQKNHSTIKRKFWQLQILLKSSK